jgi:hypothetical protein
MGRNPPLLRGPDEYYPELLTGSCYPDIVMGQWNGVLGPAADTSTWTSGIHTVRGASAGNKGAGK